MEWEPYRALYLHVPFCKRRCFYCDFKTCAVDRENSILDTFTDEMVLALRQASRDELLGKIETVYIGGGTPSHLGLRRLADLVYALSLSMHLTPEVECTLEVNPESVTLPLVKDLYALGVTRVSMGVQSFNDELLARLGRVHTADQARRALETIECRFENVSVDLMCGLPGQTVEMFLESVDEAIERGVKHVSVYPLMIEEGTPFDEMVRRGELVVDEDAGALHMEVAAKRLEAAGMHRYEVASYAYPGFESRHNTAYWTGVPYLGLGEGAVSMRQNDLCRERLEGDEVVESLDCFQMAAEDLMLAMRMSRGVSDEDLRIASLLLPEAPGVLASLQADGLVEHVDGRWRPTHSGWVFGNRLYGRLLDLAP